MELASSIVQNLKSTNDKSRVAAKYKVTWHKINGFKRDVVMAPFAAEIREQVFNMPLPTKDRGSYAFAKLKNDKIIVISLDKYNISSNIIVSSLKIENLYKEQWAIWDYLSLTKFLRSRAKIKYYF